MTGIAITTQSRIRGGGGQFAVALLTGAGYAQLAFATPPNPVFYEPLIYQSAKVGGNWVSGSHPVGIAIVDLTTGSGGGSIDGWNDILVANGDPGNPSGHKSVTIYRNDTNWDVPSSAVFEWHATYELSGYGVPWDVGAADMDGGGKPDIVVAMVGNSGDQYVLILNNLGNGSWDYQNPTVVTFEDVLSPMNLALADLNYTPDNRKDLAVATTDWVFHSHSWPAIGWALQQSNGTMTVQSLLIPDDEVSATGSAIRAAKLKSTGLSTRRDLLLGIDGGEDPFIGLGLNESTGWALSRFGATFAAPSAVVAGRMRNGYNYNDVVVVPPMNNFAKLYKNNGSGGFSEADGTITWSTGSDSFGADAGDVNSDGKADVAVACTEGIFPNGGGKAGGVALLLSAGDETFEDQAVTVWKDATTDSKPCFVKIGDLNNDTCLDLVVSLTLADRISVIVNEKVIADNNQLYLACGDEAELGSGGGEEE